MSKNILSVKVLNTPLNNNNYGAGNGASADFNNDGYADIVFATDISSTSLNRRTPVAIYTYNSVTKSFDPFKVTIDGISNIWPDVNFGMYIATSDINNDGIPDFIPIDQNEHPASPSTYGPFTGAYQYAYISKSIGNYNKVDLGIGLANMHGWAAINSTDGKFRIAANTPWTGSNPSNFSISTYNDSTGQFDSQLFNDGDSFFSSAGALNSQYFFTTGVDVNDDGNTDIIGLTAPNGINAIYLNNGLGGFTFSKTIDIGLLLDVYVEEVSVGDFNGDGFQDFVALGIDRRGANPSLSKYIRVLINDQNGGFTDQTTAWLGNHFQNSDDSYGYIDTMDINKDGKSDLLWNHFTTNEFINNVTVNVIDVMISMGNTFDLFTMGSEISSPKWDSTISSIGGRLIPISDSQVLMPTDWSFAFNSIVTFIYNQDFYPNHIKITGDEFANKLTGSIYDDYIDGGIGPDKMNGLFGNDVYVIDNNKDIVTEKSNQGIDTVITSITYTLGSNVENLTLSGTTGLSAKGNSLANLIIGSSGNDTINGLLGSDTLTGGLGNDTFVFNTKLGPANIDTITDFTSGDKIALAGSVFSKLKGDKDLSDNLYVQTIVGISTQDTNDYLFYDLESGRLYYDADGSGTKSKPIEVAIIGTGGTSLTANDFSMVN
jgi:Ca2+-binding RTX toxin-like protein